MKVCVVGAGGVGGYFGGKLARSGVEVWFLARGAHLLAMRQKGLRILAADEQFIVPPGRMTDRAEEIGTCDVVLFCVKSYDTETAARRIGPLVADHTIVISLQNGIDNPERIRSVVRTGTVYGGVAYIYATITAPGEIRETGGLRKIVFGPLEAGAADVERLAGRLLGILEGAGIRAALSADIRTELWKKFIFISAVGGLTALSRLTLGEILAVEETERVLKEAMMETAAVALAQGIAIERTFIPEIFQTLRRFDNPNRSSLYHDLMQGKPLEIEAFSGTVVRLGEHHGISTPIHRMLYALLLPHHLAHRQPPTPQPPDGILS